SALQSCSAFARGALIPSSLRCAKLGEAVAKTAALSATAAASFVMILMTRLPSQTSPTVELGSEIQIGTRIRCRAALMSGTSENGNIRRVISLSQTRLLRLLLPRTRQPSAQNRLPADAARRVRPTVCVPPMARSNANAAASLRLAVLHHAGPVHIELDTG